MPYEGNNIGPRIKYIIKKINVIKLPEFTEICLGFWKY